MSFLRISRGVARGKTLATRTVTYSERNQETRSHTVSDYVSCKAKFVTRKKAGEYVYRVGEASFRSSWKEIYVPGFGHMLSQTTEGGFVNGDKPTDFGQRTVSAPRAHDPRHVVKRDVGRGRRVYKHGLVWRVTVEDNWVSDHATMADALAGINPIGVEPGKVEKAVVYLSQ